MIIKQTQFLLALVTLVWGASSLQALMGPVNQSPVATTSSAVVSPVATATESVQATNPSPAPSIQNKIAPSPTPKIVARSSKGVVVAQPVTTVEPTSFNHTQAPTLIASDIPVMPSPASQISYAITASGLNLVGKIETQGESVGEVTKKIAQKHGVSFVYQTSELGWFITEIAGVKQNPAKNQFWLFYVNGQFSQAGADKALLQPGNTLTWQLSS